MFFRVFICFVFALSTTLRATEKSTPVDHPIPDLSDAPTCNIPLNDFSGYTLLGKIGSGAYGQVWKAEQRISDTIRIAAVAKLFPGPDGQERAKYELSNLEILEQHEKKNWTTLQRTPHVLASNVTGSVPHIVLELLQDSENLHNFVVSRKPLSQTDFVRLLEETLISLDTIHSAGLIHQDIKPSNLMVAPNFVVSIIDLGVARLKGATPNIKFAFAHTPETAAPEQKDGKLEEVSFASDIFALGKIFRWIHEKGLVQIPETPWEKEVGVKFLELIDKCANPIPSNRFENAGAALVALRALRESAVQSTQPRVRRPFIAATFATIAGVLGFGAYEYRQTILSLKEKILQEHTVKKTEVFDPENFTPSELIPVFENPKAPQFRKYILNIRASNLDALQVEDPNLFKPLKTEEEEIQRLIAEKPKCAAENYIQVMEEYDSAVKNYVTKAITLAEYHRNLAKYGKVDGFLNAERLLNAAEEKTKTPREVMRWQFEDVYKPQLMHPNDYIANGIKETRDSVNDMRATAFFDKNWLQAKFTYYLHSNDKADITEQLRFVRTGSEIYFPTLPGQDFDAFMRARWKESGEGDNSSEPGIVEIEPANDTKSARVVVTMVIRPATLDVARKLMSTWRRAYRGRTLEEPLVEIEPLRDLR